MFRTHEIRLPAAFVEKHGLPTSLVTIEHVKELLKFQSQSKLKVAPGLTEDAVEPNHFQVMLFINTFQIKLDYSIMFKKLKIKS